LCDSGGQYYGGTTDVTRTILLGKQKPKKEFTEMYTRVLIGHLNLSMIKFPIGTKGYQIDSLARFSLWENGVDFNHGTGHGVGSFLNVHEGPQSISKNYSDVELQEGMIVSNEPGFYKNGEYGIRIENLVLVKKSDTKNFLEFETLTMFPYEENLIDKGMLNTKQKNWINNYHNTIYKNISPHISSEERVWLRKKTFNLTLSRE
jgi:Xaa-Pro aminopeptidase